MCKCAMFSYRSCVEQLFVCFVSSGVDPLIENQFFFWVVDLLANGSFFPVKINLKITFIHYTANMVCVQPLQIENVLTNVHEYFEKQKMPFKAKTLANRVNITPKQARYVLRKYFNEHLIKDKLVTKRYYVKK